MLKTDAVARLDQALAHYNAGLPRLKEFILPAGTRSAAIAHVARTVARRAERALDQAAAMYRFAVLTAFQNVADALHALDTDADALSAASRAAEAAQKSLDVAHHQHELGPVNYLALVAAEQTYQQAVLGLVQARANRYADTAALFQALGGSIAPPAAHP